VTSWQNICWPIRKTLPGSLFDQSFECPLDFLKKIWQHFLKLQNFKMVIDIDQENNLLKMVFN